ncbi:MAG TPA: extracellular solute-binding protein [Acetivibrio sp.]|nr:extracellular solute-binding protein [Acetivibrio sp.]HPT90726.1 extracellular solute-binding protein [Acetivibrio sp.]HQA57586.1 extracellular solute-binding protein [Acetivibrio sp.]
MRFLEKAKFFVAGMITTAIIATSLTAYTMSMRKTITVDYRDIKINVDGKRIDPKDGNGRRVEPFIFEGTTYLPVRAVSEALGKQVLWDGDTYTIDILSNPSEDNESKKYKTVLDVWIMPNSENLSKDFMKIASPFLQDNPDIGLNVTMVDWGSAWTKLTAAYLTGEGAPDVTQMGTTWVAAFADMGALADLSEEINWDEFHPQTLGSTGIARKKERYAVPWFADTRAIYYRIDACEKAGVDPKKDFETWDSFKEALKKLNNVEINGKKLSALGMPGKNDWNVIHNYAPWIYGAGGSFLNLDYTQSTLSSKEAFNGIKFYSELAFEGLMDKTALEKDTNSVEEAFINGDFATSILGPWVIINLERNNNENDISDKIGVAMLPKGAKGRFAFLGGSSLAVFRGSHNKKEAVELLKCLISKEAQVEYSKMTGNMPVVKSAYEDPWIKDNRLRNVFADQMNYAIGYPSIPAWSPLETYLHMALAEVWDNVTQVNGEYSPDKTMEVLKKCDQKVNALIEDLQY